MFDLIWKPQVSLCFQHLSRKGTRLSRTDWTAMIPGSQPFAMVEITVVKSHFGESTLETAGASCCKTCSCFYVLLKGVFWPIDCKLENLGAQKNPIWEAPGGIRWLSFFPSVACVVVWSIVKYWFWQFLIWLFQDPLQKCLDSLLDCTLYMWR